MATTTLVRDAPDRSRYELVVDGKVLGVADYRIVGDVAEFPHTVVEPAHRGRGLGAILVRGALDDVRSRGLSVVAGCWYVAEFIASHPEYEDLLATPA
jgi:uncharacterized protein